ncbi:hypothetical protein RHDC4_01282 [Rhodocyclaceae bacterium]|nr:hypothetical protein RHDC4_01282 [Rhodocyclaceae bacterium]
MSAIRTANVALRIFKLKLVRLRAAGLTYPRPSWVASVISLPLWATMAWYVTSIFDVDPKLGVRGAECVMAGVMSKRNIVFFILAMFFGLLFFVGRQVGSPITAESRMRWWWARLSVAFSLTFLNLFSVVGAVAVGVGIFVVFHELRPGVTFLLLGGWAIVVGELFKFKIFPGLFQMIPKLRRNELLRSVVLMAAGIGMFILIEGLAFGTWQSDASNVTNCKLVVRYE